MTPYGVHIFSKARERGHVLKVWRNAWPTSTNHRHHPQCTDAAGGEGRVVEPLGIVQLGARNAGHAPARGWRHGQR